MTGFNSKREAAADKLQEPAQEPVAWMHVQGNYKEPSFRELADDEVKRGWEQYPLYNTPPQRPWVGLTAEETSGFTSHEMTVVKYVSKVLQEKNT